MDIAAAERDRGEDTTTQMHSPELTAAAVWMACGDYHLLGCNCTASGSDAPPPMAEFSVCGRSRLQSLRRCARIDRVETSADD